MFLSPSQFMPEPAPTIITTSTSPTRWSITSDARFGVCNLDHWYGSWKVINITSLSLTHTDTTLIQYKPWFPDTLKICLHLPRDWIKSTAPHTPGSPFPHIFPSAEAFQMMLAGAAELTNLCFWEVACPVASDRYISGKCGTWYTYLFVVFLCTWILISHLLTFNVYH